jgi:hypothetical protein
MNANELAEILESDSKHTSGRFTYSSRYIADIATMLRQQQAEMDIVIKLLCGEQISDDLMTHWNPLHSTLKSKLLKAQEK